MLARMVWVAARWVWIHFVRRPCDLREFGASEGAWAVVSGAGAGIGRAFALELAKDGFSLVLLDRPGGGLGAVCREAEACFARSDQSVVQVEADAALPNEAVEKILATLREREINHIRMLINNVGVSATVHARLCVY